MDFLHRYIHNADPIHSYYLNTPYNYNIIKICDYRMHHNAKNFYHKFYSRLFVSFDVKCHVKEAALSFDPRVLASITKMRK